MALGRIAHAITFTDDVTTTGSATALYPLGTLRMEETSSGVGVEVYRYVKYNDSGVAAIAGGLAYKGTTQASNTGTNPWVVTMDVSDANGAFAVGVLQSVLADTKFGWVKTKGFQANLLKTFGSALNWTAGGLIQPGTAASMDGMAKMFKSASTGGSKVSAAEVRAIRIVGYAFSTATSATHVGKAWIDME